MDYMMRLLLTVSACALGAPAQPWERDYEPYMFAAIPLHAPVPVLRVLSRAPLAAAASGRHAVARPYAEPTRSYADISQHYGPEPGRAHRYAAEPTRGYAGLAPARGYGSGDPLRHFAEPPPHPSAPLGERQRQYEPEYEESSPPYSRPAPYEADVVLYARPTASGGYTYRRAAAASEPLHRKAPAPAPLKEKEPPFILKIHKYRIIKDDLF